ncbi:MAG: guanylate kinase [Polyangia bacterium]
MNMTTGPTRRSGMLFVISSPSGAGKTTLARMVADSQKLVFSVSYTTRAPRPGERDSVDYKFVTDDEFSRMVERQEFAEWAIVHGNRYGTAVHAVNRALEDGTDYLFDIDWQGGQQIRRQWPTESVLIFILPPTMAELERRLRRRATDSPEAIQRRLAMAKRELEHYGDYDYLVVNDNLDRAHQQLNAIVEAARCSRQRSAHLAEELLEEGASVGVGASVTPLVAAPHD